MRHGSARIKGYPVYISHTVYVLYPHPPPLCTYVPLMSTPETTEHPPCRTNSRKPSCLRNSGCWPVSPLRDVVQRVCSGMSRWSRSPIYVPWVCHFYFCLVLSQWVQLCVTRYQRGFDHGPDVEGRQRHAAVLQGRHHQVWRGAQHTRASGCLGGEER